MNEIIENKRCLACDQDTLLSSLNLTNQPLANNFKKSANDSESRYPLGVNLCPNCYHLQLTHTVDPKIIYSNYLYVSGTSNTLREYSDWFANYVDESVNVLVNRVLDIGCNDGTQLDSFKKLGYDTFGVDPAENIYPTSSKNHSVICDFFGPNIVSKIKTSFDAITAQNVMAHNPNPYEFLLTCKELMSDHTLLFVQTSQADLVLNNEFDTIYHEHINFFNINSMTQLAKRTGLNLINVEKTPIHGNSYVFVFSKVLTKKHNMTNKLGMENKLCSLETYTNWENNVKANMSHLKETINEYRNNGYKIIGYGAAAKGNTLLNFINIQLDSILDDSSLKQNLYSPGTNVLISSPNSLESYSTEEKLLFVPLAWNFFKEISTRIKSIRHNKNDVFLKYFPKVEVVNV